MSSSNERSVSQLINCSEPQCNKSWFGPESSTTEECYNCIQNSPINRSSNTDCENEKSPDEMQIIMVAPPQKYSIESKHYYISTSHLRGDLDGARSQYFSLNITEIGSSTPQGLQKLAKISDCFNDTEKANMSSKFANGIFVENRKWFFPLNFYFDDGNRQFKFKRDANHAILISLQLLNSGKAVALWLKSNDSIGIDGTI